MNEQSKDTMKSRETKVVFPDSIQDKMKKIEFPESVIKNIAE